MFNNIVHKSLIGELRKTTILNIIQYIYMICCVK